MNAKETKSKMDREVKLRMLLVKLNREFSRVQETLSNLQRAVYNESTVECTIELTEEEMESCADGFHGKSYAAYQKSCLADTVYDKDYNKELVLPE